LNKQPGYGSTGTAFSLACALLITALQHM